VLDQLTKYLALTFLSEFESIPLIPNVFHLTLVRNSGVAFGLFRDHQSVLFLLITISLIVLFVWGLFIQHKPGSMRWSLALILGGAVGNWIDRLRFKAVIDFLDFRVWPVFNVADSAITLGVAIYLLNFFLKRKTQQA